MFDLQQAKNPQKIWNHMNSRESFLTNGVFPPPVSIEIQPTNSCNLRCRWCSYWRRNGFDEFSSNELCLDVLANVAEYVKLNKVKGIYLSGGGEPCAYRHIGDATTLFHQAGAKIGLITNGTMFETKLGHLANLFTYLQVSIISPDRGEYQSSTGRDQQRRIACLPGSIKRHWGKSAPIVGGMFVLSRWNYKHAPDVLDFAKEAGFDYCAFRRAIDYEGRGTGIPDEITRWLMAHVKWETSASNTYTNLGEVLAPSNSTSVMQSRCTCIKAALSCNIAPSGDVYLCVPDIGTATLSIGNLNATPFSNIWGSQKHQEKIVELQARYNIGGCLATCRSHAYNRALAERRPKATPVLHSEFI